MDHGVVIWVDHQKGYGFIKRNDCKEMFMHSKLISAKEHINAGDRVQFESSINLDGLATSVELVKQRQRAVNF